jgi:cell division protein FtsB
MQINTEQYKNKILSYAQRLNDIRFTGQLVFAVIVLLITWSGIKSIQANYGLQKQIASLHQQNELQQLQNNNLALQNEYLNSNQYLDLSARQSFGLAAPGEKEIIVPSSIALSYTTNLPSYDKKVVIIDKQPLYQKNFESWIDFFLHRQGNN